MTQTTSHREWLSAGLILVLAAVWRLTGLGAESFWTDEIAAVLVSQRSLTELLFTIGVQDVNPPFFYMILHFWLYLGEAEWWLRLLPALCGLGLVAATWRLGRKLGDPFIGLVAALLVSFSPLAVYLSRELRYHSLVALLAVGALLAFSSLLDSGGRRHRGLYFALCALGLYTHYYFLFIPFITLVWWWYENSRHRLPFRRLAPAWGLPLLAFLPWLAIIAIQSARASFRFRPLLDLGGTLFDLAGYATIGHADIALPLDPGGWARLWYLSALIPFWVLAGAGFSAWPRERAVRLAALALGVPLVTVLLASRLLPVYGHRYLFPFLPLFLLLTAVGVKRLCEYWRPLGLIVLGAVLLLMSGSNLWQRHDARFQREDWRGLSACLQKSLTGDDMLLAYNDSQLGPLRYYWRRQTKKPPLYAKLFTGDPLTFATDTEDAVAARVNLFRQQARRLWLLDHFAHMYDPAGLVHRALNDQAVFDPTFPLANTYRIPVRVYWRNRGEMLSEVGEHFTGSVNFGANEYHPLQLAGDWSHTEEEWAWLGRKGFVYLRAGHPAAGLKIRAWYSPKFHADRPLYLTVLADSVPVAEFELNGDQPQEFYALLDSWAPAGAIVEITLLASHTFDPALVIGGDDHAPKSIQITAIGLK